MSSCRDPSWSFLSVPTEAPHVPWHPSFPDNDSHWWRPVECQVYLPSPQAFYWRWSAPLFRSPVSQERSAYQEISSCTPPQPGTPFPSPPCSIDKVSRPSGRRIVQ